MTEIALGWAMALVYVVLTAIAIRVARTRSPANTAVVTGLFVYLFSAFIFALTAGPLSFWSFSIAYGFGAVCFLMVFGAVYKSISLRILLLLLKSPGRCASASTLLREYVRQDSFERRIKVAVDSGLAQRQDGRLALRRKGRRLALAVDMLQRFFAIRHSG